MPSLRLNTYTVGDVHRELMLAASATCKTDAQRALQQQAQRLLALPDAERIICLRHITTLASSIPKCGPLMALEIYAAVAGVVAESDA